MHNGTDTAIDREKKRIRAAMRARRRDLSCAEQAEASRCACAHLLSLEAYRRARCVMAYMACRGELSLMPVIEEVLDSGRTLVLPRCEAPGVMTARRVTALSQLVIGSFGLLEPDAQCGIMNPQAIDLILVPGTAFDRAGGRIGQGGGFYDRYLSGTRAVRVGVCHEFALLDHVPAAQFDARMDWIVTPAGAAHRISDKQEELR